MAVRPVVLTAATLQIFRKYLWTPGQGAHAWFEYTFDAFSYLRAWVWGHKHVVRVQFSYLRAWVGSS